jgi:molybdopterin molybdotransferase
VVIPLQEARAFVIDACPILPPWIVPIDDALGCISAATVVARHPVPPFANSAKDGYALRAIDTLRASDRLGATRLEVVGSIMAGSTFGSHIGAGQAVRIMTGAPLPPGADTVCMLEDVIEESSGSFVVVAGALRAGVSVRDIGEDVEVGDVIVPAQVELTPAHLGALANQGITQIEVRPRPRIGVLSTGDELVADDAPLLPGKIRDANRHSLLALVRQQGWDAVDLGIVGDDETAMDRAFEEGANVCDAIVTSGGVSMGDLDVVKLVLERRSNGTMRWMQVAIQPAKPLAFGVLAATRTPVFGLPGNPVSAMVSFELFVRPAGRRLAGHTVIERPKVRATAQEKFVRTPDGKTHFVRCVLHIDRKGNWLVRPLAGQQSHHLLTMARANSLAVLPDGDGIAAGTSVEVMMTDVDRLETQFESAIGTHG